jgi:tetratricopeptide (TPR) repeat protein
MTISVTTDATHEVDELLWQLYTDLAETAFCLGDVSRAVELLLTAAEQAKRLGPNEEKLADTLNRIGVLFYYQRKYDPARALVERALGIHERAGGGRVVSARLLYNLAGICDAEGDSEKAEAACKKACEILQEGEDGQDPELATTLLKLGEIYLAQDRPLQAMFAFQRALSIMDARRIEDWVTAAILTRIGDYYVIQRRPDEAEVYYWRALEIRRELFGEDPAIVKTLDRIVSVYCQERKFDQAQLLETWSLSILEKSLGADHPQVLATIRRLAATLRAQGKLVEVRELFHLSLPVFEQSFGADDPRFAQVLDHYADVLRTLREPASASEFASRARNIRRRHDRPGPSFPPDSDVGARIAALVSSASGERFTSASSAARG